MTYPKNFTTLQLEKLRKIVDIIETLAPGDSAKITAKTPKALQELRILTYAWLSKSHSNRKEEFKIKTTLPTEFLLIRIPDSDFLVERLSAPQEHPHLKDFVHIRGEEELAEALRADDSLTIEDKLKIHSEWRKLYE